MQVRQLVVGELGTNCYLVTCEQTNKTAVIDPGGDAPAILQAIESSGAELSYILNTHGHLDHILACGTLKKATGAKVAIHPLDAKMLSEDSTGLATWLGVTMPVCQADLLLNEGDQVRIGSLTLDVIHTPGHTPGHVTFLTEGAAFVGDVLFYQGIGRTDFPGGNARLLMDSIRNRLLSLDDSTVVYPGHGPTTTIGNERRLNPWL